MASEIGTPIQMSEEASGWFFPIRIEGKDTNHQMISTVIIENSICVFSILTEASELYDSFVVADVDYWSWRHTAG